MNLATHSRDQQILTDDDDDSTNSSGYSDEDFDRNDEDVDVLNDSDNSRTEFKFTSTNLPNKFSIDNILGIKKVTSDNISENSQDNVCDRRESRSGGAKFIRPMPLPAVPRGGMP